MAKDFAFLFYVNDWAGGTQWLTRLERGAYLDLLLYQVNNICFTHEIAKQILGADYDTVWANLAPKFVEENGKLWNKKMRAVLESRQKYTDSRRNNRLGIKKKTSVRHKKNISKTYVQHMGNESVNENGNENINGIEPSQAMIEEIFSAQGLTKKEGEDFFKWVKGKTGWHKINDWKEYTLSVIARKKTQSQEANKPTW